MIILKKKHLKNKNSFLGLMKSIKNNPLNIKPIETNKFLYAFTPTQFAKKYIPLLSLIYIFEFSCF